MMHRSNHATLIGVAACTTMTALLFVAPSAFAQCQRAQLSNEGADNTEYMGWCVDIDGDTAVSTALNITNYIEDVFVYRLRNGEWVETARLAPDFSDYYSYVSSRAYAQISNDVIVAGGWISRYNDQPAHFVFRRHGDQWTIETELTTTGLSGIPRDLRTAKIDGDWIFINLGGVRAFHYDGAEWLLEQTVLPAEDDMAIANLALSGDVAAVQVVADSSSSLPDGIHMFRYDGSLWRPEQVLTSATGDAHFEQSMNLHGDDLIASSFVRNDGDFQFNVCIYHFDGVQWSQQADLSIPQIDPYFWFGQSCDIRGDLALIGCMHVVGMPVDSEVLIYERTDSQWTSAGRMFAADEYEGSWFASSLAMTDQHAIIGAPMDLGPQAFDGLTYIFDLDVADCNLNAWCDDLDILEERSFDANGDHVPDECDCPGDLNGDRVVNISDLAILLANYAAPDGMSHADGDIDFDGDVDISDLAYLLAVYGDYCPFPM